MKYKAARIRWADAAHIGPGEWIAAVPDDTIVTITSVGFVLDKNKHAIVIAQSFDPDGNLTGVFSIPRQNILKVTYL